MRIAILSDIHGNIEASDRDVKSIRDESVDQIVFFRRYRINGTLSAGVL